MPLCHFHANFCLKVHLLMFLVLPCGLGRLPHVTVWHLAMCYLMHACSYRIRLVEASRSAAWWCMGAQATNADLANRLYASPEVSGSARFSKPKLSQTGFSIEHYAGPVTYKTDYFLPKNRDFVVAEHQVLLQASSQTFVQLLFPSEAEANGNVVSSPTCCTSCCTVCRFEVI